MKQLKLNSKRKSSGQVIVLLIIVLGLVGAAFWWLNSTKQEMAKEGTDFARKRSSTLLSSTILISSIHGSVLRRA